jgi:hypothetical protein
MARALSLLAVLTALIALSLFIGGHFDGRAGMLP